VADDGIVTRATARRFATPAIETEDQSLRESALTTVQFGQRAIRNVVEEGVLADQVGIDFIGVGEHHRVDFAISSPETVLATISGRTENIKLGSAVTVLSSDDPVRVYQRFATLDALSNGRAEVILGRGSFIESFPLFGYELSQYEQLFEEKLELFAELRHERASTWSGETRAALDRQRVFPRTEKGGVTTWVGVGGSPASVVRAARYGLPLVIAIIGGESVRFRPFVDLYRDALEELGQPRLPVAVHSPGTSPTPTRRPGSSCGRTGGSSATASVVSADGARRASPSSRPPPGPAERCTSAHPTPSLARSRRPWGRWISPAST
jgi:alkanesulfonate monooxygenase SsuD/methylene tetrahydromethanopterin reductase-like flavin-dependent oxidoreductase (luciferase family)